jgi:hypothetical protein
VKPGVASQPLVLSPVSEMPIIDYKAADQPKSDIIGKLGLLFCCGQILWHLIWIFGSTFVLNFELGDGGLHDTIWLIILAFPATISLPCLVIGLSQGAKNNKRPLTTALLVAALILAICYLSYVVKIWHNDMLSPWQNAL